MGEARRAGWPVVGRALALVAALAPTTAWAELYEVGPGRAYEAIGDVPWEALGPGDEVRIHWRPEPYREKWVMAVRGTEAEPIVVRGVRGPDGQRPVVSGEDATTRGALRFWNEERGLLKIGGASVPEDTLPAWIVVEGISFRSAHPDYRFTSASGERRSYRDNAAAIYVEKAEHLVIRDCELTDSANGLFVGAFDGATRDVLIEGNEIHGNGVAGSVYQHNSYTAAIDIVFQFNHYGALRPGARGNNLKDRSAGLVVRYNWIEDGNRQLDLVDAEDSRVLVEHPAYRTTFVYGNVLVEGPDQGNRQIVHYGGDSGTTADYRKGTLFFFHNTVVVRHDRNSTLVALSTDDERAVVANNVLYTVASGDRFGIFNDRGTVVLRRNLLKPGWTDTFESRGGTLDDDGSQVEADDFGLEDEAAQDYRPAAGSPALDAAGPLPDGVPPEHAPLRQYVVHARGEARPDDGMPDLGAFERCEGGGCAPATPPDGGTPGGDGGPGGDDGGVTVPDAAAGDGGGRGLDAGSDGAGSGAGDEAGGCGCRASGAGDGGGAAALLLLGLWFGRRRRPARPA